MPGGRRPPTPPPTAGDPIRAIIPLALIVGCIDDPESDGFYLHPNDVTVLCPDVVSGSTGLVDGRTYVKVSEYELSREPYDSVAWAQFCTSGVRSMFNGFYGADSFSADISSWDTSSVVDMAGMFRSAEAFNGDIRAWDTSNVADMTGMFLDARRFDRNLSSWCVDLIPTKPGSFDTDTWAWDSPRPVWGTCP